jgi:hypothetical protein
MRGFFLLVSVICAIAYAMQGDDSRKTTEINERRGINDMENNKPEQNRQTLLIVGMFSFVIWLLMKVNGISNWNCNEYGVCG